jgi:hypothetical protein
MVSDSHLKVLMSYVACQGFQFSEFLELFSKKAEFAF